VTAVDRSQQGFNLSVDVDGAATTSSGSPGSSAAGDAVIGDQLISS
jgi:hypothetical protein